jgi:hypothetical protein
MSQRLWNTEDGWKVLTGWDRPLQHFFLNIDRICRGCNGSGELGEKPNDICPVCGSRGEEFLFDNLGDETGLSNPLGGMSLDTVKLVLEQKLTWYPPTLMADLAADRANNAGNQIERYENRGEERKA